MARKRCCDEPKCNHSCPLCPDDHPVCEFRAGSLWCHVERCLSPHHRKAPVLKPGFKPGSVRRQGLLIASPAGRRPAATG